MRYLPENTLRLGRCVVTGLALQIGLLAGCNSHLPRSVDLMPINSEILTSPTVTIDVYSINGVMPPQKSWDRAIERFKANLLGQLVVNMHQLSVPVNENGLPNNDINIDAGHEGLDCVMVVFLPKDPKIRRGLYTRFSNGAQLIQYDAEGIEKSVGGILPRGTIWEIVLLHELGHAIGVPADISHADEDGHCTNPSCVMYPRPDVNSFLSLIAHGWPSDFCKACRDDIERAKHPQDK